MSIVQDTQNDPAVKLAMRQVANSVANLYRAIDALGDTTSRFAGVLPTMVGGRVTKAAVEMGQAAWRDSKKSS